MRKRRYYYENVFGVDIESLSTLEALSRKYSRDYLTFFNEIASLYKQGPHKRRADETINLVKKLISLLDNIVDTKEVSRKDTNVMYGLIDRIEESKQYFVEQSHRIQALRDKLSDVFQTTGISPEDLTATKKLAKSGVQQFRRATREGVSGFLERTAPRTARTLGGIGRSAVTAALGPYSPIARMGVDLLKDLGGVSSGLLGKIRERGRGSRLSSLRPAHLPQREPARTPTSVASLGDVFGGTRSPRSRRETVEERARPLRVFFDRGAYQSRWTVDLLSTLKDIKKGFRKGVTGEEGLLDTLDDTVGLLGKFGKGIIPLVGKAGLLVGLAASAAFAASQLRKLPGAWKEWRGEQEELGKSGTALGGMVESQIDRVRDVGLSEFARRTDQSPEEVIQSLMEDQRLARQNQWLARQHDPTALSRWEAGRSLIDRIPALKELGEKKRRQEILEKIGRPSSATVQQDVPQIGVPEVPGMSELSESLQALSDKLGSVSPPPSEPEIMGGVYDAGDILTREHSRGGLTVGE